MIKRAKSQKQLNNGGFTLVELICTMAILVIVGMAVLAFMVYTLNMYNRSSNDINVQYESQICAKQIDNLILTTTNGVSMNKDQDELILYNLSGIDRLKYSIKYDAKNNAIMFREYKYEGSNWVPTDSEAEVFANYVKSVKFTILDQYGNAIDVEKANENSEAPRKIVYEISFESDGRSFDSRNETALRNSVVAGDIIRLIYE